MNFRGSTTYQTNIGAIMSVMIVLIVGSYGLIKLV